MSIRPDSKTVVIGMGGGGANIVGRLKRIIEDEEYSEDEFLFIGLDSREVRDIGIDDRWTIQLDWNGVTEWQSKQDSYFYLSQEDGPPSNEGGVDRNRPVARGVFDDASNVSTVVANITSAVDVFAGDEQNVDIWVVNSLGGGTGSGSQAMLLGLLQALEQAEFGRMNLFALSTAPRLNIDPDTQFPGDIDVEAVPNAFGALTELRQLVDVAAYENPPNLEIELQLDTNQVELFRAMDGSSLPLRRDALQSYYLLGIDENRIEEGDEGYEQVIEETAALTIIAQAMAEENFPDRERPKFAGRLLRTVDATACSFPYSDVTEYVATATQSRWLEEQQHALSEVDNEFTAAERLLQKVSKVRQGEDDIESSRVKNLITYVENQLEAATGAQYWDETDIIRENTLQLISTTDEDVQHLSNVFNVDALDEIDEEYRPGAASAWLAAQTEDDEYLDDDEDSPPARLVLEYLFYIKLQQDVTTEAESQKLNFQNEVDDLYDELRDKMDTVTRDDFNTQETYKEKWRNVLSPFVDRRIDEVREGGLIRSGDEERANELTRWQSDIDECLSSFTEWTTVSSELNTLTIQIQDRLRNLLEWYDDEREAIFSSKEAIERKRESLDGQMENIAGRLSRSSGEKFLSMRIANPDEVITAYFTESGKNELAVIEDLIEAYGLEDEANPRKAAIDSHLRNTITIHGLEQRSIIDAEELETDLRNAVSGLEERVADNGSIQNSVILPVAHDEDKWFEALGKPSANYNNTLLMGLDELASAKIADARGQVSGGMPGVIKFLFVNPDVTLDNASEYTTIKEWYESGELSGKLGADYEDPAKIVNFAYPELADITTGKPVPQGEKEPIEEDD